MSITTNDSAKFDKMIDLFVALIITLGMGLSIYSYLNICTEACAESHNYRLFGLKFEYIGFLFFGAAAVLHFLSQKNVKFAFLTGLCFAGAVGSEIWLIYFQKYIIKQLCPVCLIIAGVIFAGAIAFLARYFIHFLVIYRRGEKGELMNAIYKGITSVSFLLVGLFVTAAGIARFDQIEAAEQTVKDSLAFGNTSSPIEVYLFTDWKCPACRALEPEIEEISPDIMRVAKMTFVDYAIHPETLNYSPYNISFMIKEKPKYLKLRHALTNLSATTGTPTDELVEQTVEPIGVEYQQLNFADISLGQKYFKQLAKQFKIHKTPTLVVINRLTKKGKKLTGGSEITRDNVMRAINSLKQ